MANNVVDILRDKNEEADLDLVLKTQMGGYTKKSVQDYVNRLRRQQQLATQSFNRDMQALLDEKDQLINENTTLKNRLTKSVADYKLLSDSISNVKAGEAAVSVEDVIQLRNRVRVLEKDKQDALNRIKQHERSLEQNKHVIGEKNRLVEQSKQETTMYQGMLAASKNEADQLRKDVSKQATKIDDLQGEVKFLKAMVSDGNVSKLNGRIDELTLNIEKLNEELALRVKEQAAFLSQIETLQKQLESDQQVNEQLRNSLDQSAAQNEKVVAENSLLNKELAKYMQENLNQLRAQSDLRVENAILSRQLEAEKLRKVVEKKK